jgi:hypothetical protein
MFPEVRDLVGRKELQELGQKMLQAKQQAPKLPSEERAGAA